MIKYLEFINEEANVYLMKIGSWVLFGGNIRSTVNPIKGIHAKIVNRGWDNNNHRTFTLELEKPILIKKLDETGQEIKVETNLITVSSSQIRSLTIIPTEYLEESKAGHNMKYHCTKTFTDILNDIGFQIKNLNFLDVSFFDTNENNDEMITFLPIGKLKNSSELKEDPYKSKFRQTTKIGKIFRKLNKNLTDVQVEKFVNDYRAQWKYYFNLGDLEKKLQIVTGDRIPYWYHMDRYVKGGGTLNNSCMRGPDKQKKVEFYSKYPDKIAMAILLDDDDKLLARALIWKLDKPYGVIFMDRIYYVKTYHSKILENYAAKNDMKTKSDGWNLINDMSIKIPYEQKEPLPYLDSFKWDEKSKEFVNK